MSRPPWDTDKNLAEKVRAGAIEFLYQQLADALDLAHRTLDALEGPKDRASRRSTLRRSGQRDARAARSSGRRSARGSMLRTAWATPTSRPCHEISDLRVADKAVVGLSLT